MFVNICTVNYDWQIDQIDPNRVKTEQKRDIKTTEKKQKSISRPKNLKPRKKVQNFAREYLRRTNLRHSFPVRRVGSRNCFLSLFYGIIIEKELHVLKHKVRLSLSLFALLSRRGGDEEEEEQQREGKESLVSGKIRVRNLQFSKRPRSLFWSRRTTRKKQTKIETSSNLI